MALDESKDEDHKVELKGFEVIIEKELLDRYGGVNVDYVDHGWRQGFSITAERDSGGSCSC